MTFTNFIPQFNINSDNGFFNTMTPSINMWNNVPLFNFDNCIKFPSFDFSNLNIFDNSNFSWNNNLSIGDSFTRTTNKLKPNTSGLKLEGYNATAGEKLAKIAMDRRQTDRWSNIKGTGKCATYTKEAIEAAGMGSYVMGDGYQMTSILSKNKNFKQISPNGIDVKDLPAGCVLVYGKGVSGYHKQYGHTEITTGDGRGVSQAITYNVRKPSAIFIPV